LERILLFLGKATTYVHEGLESKLKPGRYILCVKARWVDNLKHDFYLNVFCSSPLRLTLLESYNSFDFFNKLYSSLGILSRDRFQMGHDCEFASGWIGSHLWFYAFNGGNKIWTLEVVFERMQNIKIAKKFRSKSNCVKFILQPNQKAAAYAKRINPGEVAMKWRLEQIWE